MTAEQITSEINRCERLKSARTGRAGYQSNLEAIEARLAELRSMTPDPIDG